MINHRVVPIVPETGSLGACGDLAQLSRVGTAMMGVPSVKVHYQNTLMSADEALKRAHIEPFKP